MLRFIFLFLFFSTQVFAQSAPIVIEPRDCKFYNALTAGSDRLSSAIDVTRFGRISFQVSWASLTGSVDAIVKIQVSNVPAPGSSDWVDKTGATFTMSGADGTNMINIVNSGEKWVRVNYAHTSVSGGTITGYCHASSI